MLRSVSPPLWRPLPSNSQASDEENADDTFHFDTWAPCTLLLLGWFASRYSVEGGVASCDILVVSVDRSGEWSFWCDHSLKSQMSGLVKCEEWIDKMWRTWAQGSHSPVDTVIGAEGGGSGGVVVEAQRHILRWESQDGSHALRGSVYSLWYNTLGSKCKSRFTLLFPWCPHFPPQYSPVHENTHCSFEETVEIWLPWCGQEHPVWPNGTSKASSSHQKVDTKSPP